MNAKRILVPTDFSHTGDAALAVATSLAKDSGGCLLIVHVEEPRSAYGGGEMYYGIPNPSSNEQRRMLHAVKPSDSSVPVEYHLITGEPVEAIVRLAESESIDLIVLGSHGRTGLGRVLMGSVAEGIVRKAQCPVLVCKQTLGNLAGATK